jgi:type II secretory pathway pseudopilin PulG
MKKTQGMALVEIVVGATIISMIAWAAASTYNTYISYALTNQKNVQASYLLEEGLEVVTYFRNKSWLGNIAPLSTSTTYYLLWSGTDWATTTTAQRIDGEFLRSVAIADVKRDGSDRIASSGTFDPNTKKITTTVSYFQGHSTTTRSISTYITNIYGN